MCVYEFVVMVSLSFLDGVKKIYEYVDGKFKDVLCFIMVDDFMIGLEMCCDFFVGMLCVVVVGDVARVSAEIDAAIA